MGVEAFAGDSRTNGDEYNFLPAGLVDGQEVGTQEYGNDVTITAVGHPLFIGLTDAGLSDWGSSYHGHLPVGSLPVLATNFSGDSLIRGGPSGSGAVVVWTLDPDYHFDSSGVAGARVLVENSLNFVPEPATLALLAIGGLALIRRRR